MVPCQMIHHLYICVVHSHVRMAPSPFRACPVVNTQWYDCPFSFNLCRVTKYCRSSIRIWICLNHHGIWICLKSQVPYYRGERITFDVAPSRLDFRVEHNSLKLEVRLMIISSITVWLVNWWRISINLWGVWGSCVQEKHTTQNYNWAYQHGRKETFMLKHKISIGQLQQQQCEKPAICHSQRLVLLVVGNAVDHTFSFLSVFLPNVFCSQFSEWWASQ